MNNYFKKSNNKITSSTSTLNNLNNSKFVLSNFEKIDSNTKLKINTNIKTIVKGIQKNSFKKIAGFGITASILIGSLGAFNVADAYKEYGNMSTKQAVETYGNINVELLQGIKIFGDVGHFLKYGFSKDQMLELDKKISEYMNKSGNYVGISIFGNNSGCSSIDDCKELNMKVKGISDNGVAILIMDTGVFNKNISVIADPNIKDFFNSSDEKYIMGFIVKPTLKNNTLNDGLNNAFNIITGKLGDKPVQTRREEIAKQNAIDVAKKEADAKIDAMLAKEEQIKEGIAREESNKKLKELTLTTLKYIVMLFAAVGIAYVGNKGFEKIKIKYKSKALYDDLNNLETTEKILQSMLKSGDIDKSQYEEYADNIQNIRTSIQNIDISSFTNNKGTLKYLSDSSDTLYETKSDIDKFLSEIAENKKLIDSELSKSIDEYNIQLEDIEKEVNNTSNEGVLNIENMKKEVFKDVKDYTSKLNFIKDKIKSDASLTFIEKQQYLDNTNSYLDKLLERVDEFKGDIEDIKKKAKEHDNNMNSIKTIKTENL